MNTLLTTAEWKFGELFTRLDTMLSADIGEGTSLVFTKLDFWLFFLLAMTAFSLMSLKWFRIVLASSLVLGLAFLGLYALPSELVKTFPHVWGKSYHTFIWAIVAAGSAALIIIGLAKGWSEKARSQLREFILGNQKMLLRSIFLTLISLFFFYKTSGLYMLLLVISVAVNYGLGNKIFKSQSDSRRKWIIAISAIFNLLILGYFKYAYFFTDSSRADPYAIAGGNAANEGEGMVLEVTLFSNASQNFNTHHHTPGGDRLIFQHQAILVVKNPLVIFPKAVFFPGEKLSNVEKMVFTHHRL